MIDSAIQYMHDKLVSQAEAIREITQIAQHGETITLTPIPPPQIDDQFIPDKYVPYYLDRILLNGIESKLPCEVKTGDKYQMVLKENFVIPQD